MADKKIVGWFTMNGVHIPIFEGESKDAAVQRSMKQRTDASLHTGNGTVGQMIKFGANYPNTNITVKDMKGNVVWQGTAGKMPDVVSKMSFEKIKSDDEGKRIGDAKNLSVTVKGDLAGSDKKKSISQQNEDVKKKQIAQNKAQADKLNNKSNQDITKLNTNALYRKATGIYTNLRTLEKERKGLEDQIMEARADGKDVSKLMSAYKIKDDAHKELMDKYIKLSSEFNKRADKGKFAKGYK